MKILLVQPPLDPTTSKLTSFGIPEPLALEYIAAAVAEHDVRILDLRIGGSLVDELTAFEPDLVGLTAVTASAPLALGLLDTVRRTDPRILTAIGGHHATLLPIDCRASQVDVIVRGDGEQALAEIVAAIEQGESLASVRGIHFQDGGRWHATPPRALVPLDEYRPPARHLTSEHRHAYHRVGIGPVLSAITSQGCSRRCSFCSIWRFHSGKYRRRSPAAIIDELAARSEPSIEFVDDDSFGDLRSMERLRELVAQELPGRAFRFFVRSDAVVRDPGLFYRWAKAGLRYASIGLESFREQDLRDYGKSATIAQNLEAVRVLKDAGIRIIGFLIVRPDFGLDDFRRIGDFVDQLDIFQPVFGTLTPYPGTILYEQMGDQIITDDWRHFDGFRAVTRTALPRQEYYQQLANLYRRAYAGSGSPQPDEELPWYERLARAIESTEDPVPAEAAVRPAR